jgi:hypothetical protein
MKIGIGATAALMLAVTAWSAPVEAQGVPRGSYLRSCQDIRVRGDTLLAVCRTVDGYSQRTSLPQVSRCVGDIGNNNGNLQCSYAGGGPAPYGQMPAPPPPPYGYAPPR